MSTEQDREKRLRKKAMSLPLRPGVYLMKDKSGTIIYVGKAKKLKNRVSQYFGSPTNHSDKVRRMVSKIEKFEYIVVGESGPDHNKEFIVEVHLNSNVIGRGKGSSKKRAEQEAAKSALELMGL